MSSKNIISVAWESAPPAPAESPKVLSASEHFSMAAMCWLSNAEALEAEGRPREAMEAFEAAYQAERQMEQALLEECK